MLLLIKIKKVYIQYLCMKCTYLCISLFIHDCTYKSILYK